MAGVKLEEDLGEEEAVFSYQGSHVAWNDAGDWVRGRSCDLWMLYLCMAISETN